LDNRPPATPKPPKPPKPQEASHER
jgi:hypothetical protein